MLVEDDDDDGEEKDDEEEDNSSVLFFLFCCLVRYFCFRLSIVLLDTMVSSSPIPPCPTIYIVNN